MAISRDRPLLCFVHSVQGGGQGALRSAVELADAGGDAWETVDLLQVRGKDLPAADLEALTRVWIDALGGRSTRIVVNDRLDVALAAGADGVHVGQDDLPAGEARALAEARGRAPGSFLVGVSAHGREEIEGAQGLGADYAGLGAFHPTGTKEGARLLREDDLMVPIPRLTIPVVAIGGITADRVADAMAFPAVSGIAVSAAIQAAEEPLRAIRELRSELERAWRERPSRPSAEGV
jgi:thiamine-phosphate pyrophosphorylase